jgi:hypothetical protein
MRPRVALLPLFVIAGLVGLGVSAALGVAQEAPATRPAGKAPGQQVGRPAQPKGGAAPPPVLARDYSIGALSPDSMAVPQAAPDAAVPTTPEGSSGPAVKAPDPQKRPRYGAAILQAVDKVTAETLRFEAKVGQPVRFKGLVVTVNTCETTAQDEDAPDSIAHLSVLTQPEGVTTAAARDAYRGWMYANSAAVHPFQHPVYDLWLIACKASPPVASVARP